MSACCDDSPHAKARNAHAHLFTANGPALASQVAPCQESLTLQTAAEDFTSAGASTNFHFYRTVGGEASVATECGRKEAKSDVNVTG